MNVVSYTTVLILLGSFVCSMNLQAEPKGSETGVSGGGDQAAVVLGPSGSLRDPDGNPLKGCNLGNWLLLEMWMLDHGELADQHSLFELFDQRFGREVREQLMQVYRSNFIRDRDFAAIRSFGFNTVRLPFHYGLLMDDPTVQQLRPDAFRWLDAAVHMAAKAGLYVILDLHGAPGGQSTDHCTGRVHQNLLWESPVFLDNTVWLWEQIAGRYKSSSVVAGYDLLNEPFGDFKTGRHLEPLVDLMDRLASAIRAIDSEHVMFFPGPQQGIDIYDLESVKKWSGVGFTEHYYPGLHGEPEVLESHARFVHQKLKPRIEKLNALGVPFLIGEFNVALHSLAAPELMRWYFDEFGCHGIASTLWSYKLLQQNGGHDVNGWGMVQNQDPLPAIDFKRSSYQEIEDFFTSLGSMPLATNEALRASLLGKGEEAPALNVFPPKVKTPPTIKEIRGWSGINVGESLPGGQYMPRARSLVIYGGGNDIWADQDQFYYLCTPFEGASVLSCGVQTFVETHPFAKAGLMVRQDTSANSPHALIHVFPNGLLSFAWRDAQGGETQEEKLLVTGLPVYLRMETSYSQVRASYSVDGREWTPVANHEFDWLKEGGYLGIAVLAHDYNESLTTVNLTDLKCIQGETP